MKMRMLTAIAASAICLAVASGAEAGGRKHDGHGAWKDYHHHGHHGKHHGSGHGQHESAGREASRGCDDHWDSNPALRPSIAFRNLCIEPGLGITIIGTPGLWAYGTPGFYRNYPYQ